MAYEEITISTNWWKPQIDEHIEGVILENKQDSNETILEEIQTKTKYNLPEHTTLLPKLALLKTGERVRITRTADQRSQKGIWYHTYKVEKWTENNTDLGNI